MKKIRNKLINFIGGTLFYALVVFMIFGSLVLSSFSWYYDLTTWLPNKVIPIWTCIILGIIPGISYIGIVIAIITFIIV